MGSCYETGDTYPSRVYIHTSVFVLLCFCLFVCLLYIFVRYFLREEMLSEPLYYCLDYLYICTCVSCFYADCPFTGISIRIYKSTTLCSSQYIYNQTVPEPWKEFILALHSTSLKKFWLWLTTQQIWVIFFSTKTF
jgi:hypothetical protein